MIDHRYGRKVFYVKARDIVRFFEAAGIPGDGIPVPRIEGLPEGYAVDYVFRDEMRDAFALVLSHPTWPAPAVDFPTAESAEWEFIRLDPGRFESKAAAAEARARAAEDKVRDLGASLRIQEQRSEFWANQHHRIEARPFRYAFRRLFRLPHA